MTSAVNIAAAREHASELARFADRRRATLSPPMKAEAPTIGLRLAGAGDAEHVRRLAALDDARELEGRVLLALRDGEPVAALSLHDGRVVANPFVFTGEAVALLHLRATQLRSAGARRRRAILRPRFG